MPLRRETSAVNWDPQQLSRALAKGLRHGSKELPKGIIEADGGCKAGQFRNKSFALVARGSLHSHALAPHSTRFAQTAHVML